MDRSRKILPRQGGKKLHRELQPAFVKYHLKVGRDCLFKILRQYNRLVKRKRYTVRTTQSYHRFYKYKNQIKGEQIGRPNQVWASDITYLKTVKGFCYLALITDMYSRKIVGYDLSDSLELSGCLKALKKALYQRKGNETLTHHSDRGIQYCSYQYTNALKQRGIRISMTEANHCYENALAERVNGILKDEFYLDQVFMDTAQAERATKNAIKLYNSKRLHLSLNYQTPNYVHEYAA